MDALSKEISTLPKCYSNSGCVAWNVVSILLHYAWYNAVARTVNPEQ